LAARERDVATRKVAEVRSTLDGELRAVLARVRPSPAELVSLWPARKRKHVAVFIRESSGEPEIMARLWAKDFDSAGNDGRAAVPSRGTVPVFFELRDGRTVIVPLRILEEAA
jgi:hypothetical protein